MVKLMKDRSQIEFKWSKSVELCQNHEPFPTTLHTTNLEAAASLNPPLNLSLSGSFYFMV